MLEQWQRYPSEDHSTRLGQLQREGIWAFACRKLSFSKRVYVVAQEPFLLGHLLHTAYVQHDAQGSCNKYWMLTGRTWFPMSLCHVSLRECLRHFSCMESSITISFQPAKGKSNARCSRDAHANTVVIQYGLASTVHFEIVNLFGCAYLYLLA